MTLVERLRRIRALWNAMAYPANVAQAGEMYDEMDKLSPSLPKAADALEAAEKALEPFAAFADLPGADRLPNEYVITLGSSMAARQLTIGDCRAARTALSKLRGTE